MNFNFDLFVDILWLGALCGIISTLCVRRLKNALPFINSKIVSIFINVSIGFCVSELFTNLSFPNSIAVGIVTWIGAETIYDTLSKKNLLNEEDFNDFDNEEYEDEETTDEEDKDQ